MSTLHITIDNAKDGYQPGEELRGRVDWQMEEPPKKARLSLLWYTEGKGTQDVEVVWEKEWDNAMPLGQETFSLRLPEGPFSWHGRLVTIRWALELLVAKEVCRQDITISPDGEAVSMRSLNPEESKSNKFLKGKFSNTR
ncbi:MAG: hypothetical protein ACLFUS_05245 [Candidatus Sumerlaeia bacterium]